MLKLSHLHEIQNSGFGREIPPRPGDECNKGRLSFVEIGRVAPRVVQPTSDSDCNHLDAIQSAECTAGLNGCEVELRNVDWGIRLALAVKNDLGRDHHIDNEEARGSNQDEVCQDHSQLGLLLKPHDSIRL
jgi:hypothetical protein